MYKHPWKAADTAQGLAVCSAIDAWHLRTNALTARCSALWCTQADAPQVLMCVHGSLMMHGDPWTVCAVVAYFIAAISPNMDVANGALPAYIVINLFFVGLLIRPQDQPKYWHWCASGPIMLPFM